MRRFIIALGVIASGIALAAAQEAPPSLPTPEQAQAQMLQKQRDNALSQAANAMAYIAMLQAQMNLEHDYWKKMWEGLYPPAK